MIRSCEEKFQQCTVTSNTFVVCWKGTVVQWWANLNRNQSMCTWIMNYTSLWIYDSSPVICYMFLLVFGTASKSESSSKLEVHAVTIRSDHQCSGLSNDWRLCEKPQKPFPLTFGVATRSLDPLLASRNKIFVSLPAAPGILFGCFRSVFPEFCTLTDI